MSTLSTALHALTDAQLTSWWTVLDDTTVALIPNLEALVATDAAFAPVAEAVKDAMRTGLFSEPQRATYEETKRRFLNLQDLFTVMRAERTPPQVFRF
jgi:hypothetical protein